MGLLGSLICILGFFMITALLYFALQNQEQQKKQPKVFNFGYGDDFEADDGVNGLPNITIFAAPRPFSFDGSDPVGARQELAVRSWLGLSPNVDVVLFGQHPFISQFSGRFQNRVTAESDIDFT